MTHNICYRGLRLRPEHDGFKLGVHKAQKAIENAIGSKTLIKLPQPPLRQQEKILQTDDNANITINQNKSRVSTASVKQSQKSSSRSSRAKTAKGSSRLLRELAPDKVYLENLMKNPNLKCKGKEEDDKVLNYIKDAVDFLNNRQEFWRQQLPSCLK